MAHRLPSIGSFGSSALHAELDVICPLEDNDDVLWYAGCGNRCCRCIWSIMCLFSFLF